MDWERHAARALELAERGRYSTSPNPRVGAVVVDPDGRLLGEGWHEKAGEPHAEARALEAAGERARGATVVVNLEPCAHVGRTPPCADALVAAGVARVLYAIPDPDPRTSGRGAARLREAGVEVREGVGAEAARRLNEPFLASVAAGRPYVHLKWATTLDGKIATRSGSSRWVSGDAAREDGMRLREECDAILAGAGTVAVDDPRLTRRLGLNASVVPHRRLVLDGRLRVTAGARVFEPTPGTEAWLVTERAEDDPELEAFRKRGVVVVSLPSADRGVDLEALLRRLADLETRSLLVEGGGETAWTFLRAGLADRVTAYVAPKLFGGAGAPTPLGGEGVPEPDRAFRLGPWEVAALGSDLRLSARVERRAG